MSKASEFRNAIHTIRQELNVNHHQRVPLLTLEHSSRFARFRNVSDGRISTGARVPTRGDFVRHVNSGLQWSSTDVYGAAHTLAAAAFATHESVFWRSVSSLFLQDELGKPSTVGWLRDRRRNSQSRI